MNEEDELYGMEGTGRFDTDEFDQEYVDGGIRDDVRSDTITCGCTH
jgi:hypothetical protein